MRMRSTILSGVLLLLLLSCKSGSIPGSEDIGSSVPETPDVPETPKTPASGNDELDAGACDWSVAEEGVKLQAFLEATQALQASVTAEASVTFEACKDMGRKLDMTDEQLEGDTKAVCDAVAATIRDHLKVGLKAGAKLEIEAKPAECRVDVDAAAEAAAKCEGKAKADVGVRCDGVCEGNCSGECDGKCSGKAKGKGKAGAGGAKGDGAAAAACEGKCDGSCKGSCTGGCKGNADVDASAECRSSAKVHASVDAKCEPPKVKVTVAAKAVVDKKKIEKLKKALTSGLPTMFMVTARVGGPIKASFDVWAKTAKDLAKAGPRIARGFGKQAMCVAGQLSAAGRAAADIEVKMEVSVEASASVSGAAGGSAGT